MLKSENYIWLNDYAQQFLEKDYLLPGQTVDQRVTEICENAEAILKKPGFANKFKNYFKRGWYSFATPIWTNFGTDRGLPISCFGTYISDDSASIVTAQAEISMMSKHGGGTSAYLGKLRERGALIKGGRNGHTGGACHFAQLFNTNINVWSQGSTRRGSFAAYLDIDHGDIMEWLTIKSEGSPIQDISFGVCVPDYWLREMKAGDVYKRKVWAKVLESRNNTGYPYIIFIDTVNRNTVDVYKNNNLRINQSNLCTEIMLPNHDWWSFVCDLSSMNILYYDEWRHTDAVEMIVYFLDAVMSEFIVKAQKIAYLHRAQWFAEANRALGLGWLGWHSYLQSKGIAWESMEAKQKNVEVAKKIFIDAYTASQKMAKEYGEPELLKGYGRRHTTLIAIAPTTSSSFILGQASKSIEPFLANVIITDLAKGKFTVKNPFLERILVTRGRNDEATWDSIMKNRGSVQHLDFLSEHEKNVFKTFSEISPMEIIIQAAQRQKWIDQAQSLNLIIDPGIPVKDVNALVLKAWELEVKSLYYQFNVNAAQQVARGILACSSCEA
jgi:ribonucleoside-diphosphate reductase alpha chain